MKNDYSFISAEHLNAMGCNVPDDYVPSDNEGILCAKIAQLIAGRKDINVCLDNAIVAIKSAYIAGIAESPRQAMVWLHNYLWGPDLLPTDEEIQAGAQAFSDEHHKY